ALERILAVVENHSAERMVDAVVQVVAELPAAHGLADDLSNGRRGGSHEETAGLRENLDRMRKEAVQFRIDGARELVEGRDRVVVVRREASADVEDLELDAARQGVGEDARGQLQRLDVVLDVGALAPDVEAQSLDF